MKALIFTVFLTSSVVPAQARYGGGVGTTDDPYLIYTAEQLNAIGLHEEDWSKCFKLMSDIDLGELLGATFQMIGTHLRPFDGVIDGNGKAVSNFTYLSTERSFIGLIEDQIGHVSSAEVRIQLDVGLANRMAL